MKVMYEDIVVGTIVTNRSMSVNEALELVSFDENEFMQKYDLDDIDYNEFWLDY